MQNINIIVIESVESEGTEWGISFTNPNPEAKDYFQMPNKETAFRLKDYLDNIEKINGMTITKATGETARQLEEVSKVLFPHLHDGI